MKVEKTSLFLSFILAFGHTRLNSKMKVEKSSLFLSFILAFVTVDLTLKDSSYKSPKDLLNYEIY